MATLRFKIACEASELEQIHRLNHATLAEEIPQHPRSVDGTLVDRFHDQNTYVVALDGDRVVGMLAVRTDRPFSLDAKVPDLDSYLPAGRTRSGGRWRKGATSSATSARTSTIGTGSRSA